MAGRQIAQRSGGTQRAEGSRGAYEKTLLYLYPHLETMSAALDVSLQTQALLSYRKREGAEALVERLLTADFQSRFLLGVQETLDELFGEFSREDMFVLEYRYFRRKRVMRSYEAEPVKMSLRTFYRRQHRVLQKFSAALRRRGMDEKWFLENFSDMDWAMRVYKKVCAGHDSYIMGKYRNSPLFRRETKEAKEEQNACMPEINA